MSPSSRTSSSKQTSNTSILSYPAELIACLSGGLRSIVSYNKSSSADAGHRTLLFASLPQATSSKERKASENDQGKPFSDRFVPPPAQHGAPHGHHYTRACGAASVRKTRAGTLMCYALTVTSNVRNAAKYRQFGSSGQALRRST